MPKENRKRGRKHKKHNDEQATSHAEEPNQHIPDELQPQAGPSWIVSAPDKSEVNPEAPFGYVDAEVKAYFRSVDVQIREWQEQGANAAEGDEDADSNEDRRLFFVAALTEMSGKEKQLATDPDCSTVLERMTYSMDDFVRRVLVDRLCGSFEQLATHRFASHVCQTLFTVASDTISRESRGIISTTPESSEDQGELRTLSQLTIDACEELLPKLSSLIMDPFASHVIRALLLLLAPDCFTPDSSSGKQEHVVRSKRSAAYKAKQGSMKSVFAGGNVGAPKPSTTQVPKEFHDTAEKLVRSVQNQLDGNEVRALAANRVASPVLQMLIEIEAGYGMADTPGSLMDRTLVGLITLYHEDPSVTPEASDYLTTLLRDPTASHLLEALVSCSPDGVFNILWAVYFKGKLNKLAVHPVANFVVARAAARLDEGQLGETCEELDGTFAKIAKSSRTGVLRALIDRCGVLHAHEDKIVEATRVAFELADPEARSLAVPCILRIMTSTDYKEALHSQPEHQNKPEGSSKRRRGKTSADEDPMEPRTQGAVLLQSLLHLSSPHNELILDSIQSLTIEELLEMARHVTSSRVLDVVTDSSTVPAKAKRKLIMTFIGRYHQLVDDRIGSRIGERLWAHADPYLKEKIARSLMPHEHFLAGSYYGKFFARSLNLHLLQRNPEQWKDQQTSATAASALAPALAPSAKAATLPPETAASSATAEASSTEQQREKRKRRAQPEDEIDALFDATLAKKIKKGELASAGGKLSRDEKDAPTDIKKGKQSDEKPTDKGLKDVLGAIRAAPKDDGGHRKSKKKRLH